MIKNILKQVMPYGMVMKHQSKHERKYESEYPRLYNKYNEEMIMMYLEDSRANEYCLMDGRYPRRILWDRYNKGLKLQMYSHLKMLDRVPKSDGIRQFGIMMESESICPQEYEIIYRHDEKIKELDCLFTYSERLLDKYENAKFTISHGVWYGTPKYGGVMDENAYDHKKKLLSIVASAKGKCKLHVFRGNAARELKRIGAADAMGNAVGAYIEKISDAYDDYMYNVAIENDSTKYYFTEKLLNCFASMTVPVYYGAKDIGKFFNTDGVVVLKEPTIDCLLRTIQQCSIKDYESRRSAIIDNFERVKKYLTIEDYLTDNYWDLFVK